MNERRLYILRHGAVEIPDPKPFIGQMELPMTDEGRRQIERSARWLKEREISHIVSSPVGRCKESADIIAQELGGVEIEIVRQFQEINLGKWQGMTVADVQRFFPGAYEARGRNLDQYRPAGGENFQDLQVRVHPAFINLTRTKEGNIAIVAHAATNRVLLAWLLQMPIKGIFRLDQSCGGINVIRQQSENFFIEMLNYLP